MSEESGQQLIEELASNLSPVRRVPRLRTMVTAILGLWMLVAALGLGLRGVRDGLLESLMTPFGPGGIFVGLAISGLGGIVAALAAGVPGRERACQVGLGLAVAGLALAAGIGTMGFLQSPVLEARADLTCLGASLVVSLVPAMGVVVFAGRHALFRPLVAVIAAAAGSAALGAISAQASCPANDLRHLMLGHVLAPAVAALLLTLPLLAALRRLHRR